MEPAARALKLDDQQFRQAARRRLEEQAHRVETETKVSPDNHVAEGKPFAEIAARCAAAGADLLVVGTHGENFLLDPFLGTMAHRVLRFAAVPILLAKKASASPYELALDGQSYLVIRWLSIPVQ